MVGEACLPSNAYLPISAYCVLIVHLFVCFVRVSFGHFSLPLAFGGWLRFVIVALPGLFF